MEKRAEKRKERESKEEKELRWVAYRVVSVSSQHSKHSHLIGFDFKELIVSMDQRCGSNHSRG